MGLWDSFKYWLVDSESKPTKEEKKIIKKIDEAIEKTGKEKLPRVRVLVVRDPDENLWPIIEEKWRDYRYKKGGKNIIKPTREGEGYGGIYLEDEDLVIVNRSKSRKSEDEFKKIYIHERLHTADFVHSPLMETWENDMYNKIK